MPNHAHGIIEINRDTVGTGRDLSLQYDDSIGHDSNVIKLRNKIIKIIALCIL